MQRPTNEQIAAYAERFQVTVDVAWRDYLQLRIAEAASRDARLKELCVWKGAFVMRYVLESPRASGDMDATVGTKRDRVDPAKIRAHLKRACQDLDIEIPREQAPEPGDESVSFAPIEWRDPAIGVVRTSIDLSLREDLVMAPCKRTLDTGIVAGFEVLHIDIHEQAAEKMRCLAQRSRVGDGMDVHLLWTARQLEASVVRSVVPAKLTSGKDHREAAREGVERRYKAWDAQIGLELPHGAPTKDEMREACLEAVDRWISR